MSSSPPSSPRPSSIASLSQETLYRPPDLPFLRDSRGEPVIRAGLSFESMSEGEANEFLGLKELDPIEMLTTIEAARKEHEKDQVSDSFLFYFSPLLLT